MFKKKRSPNYTQQEKDILLSLVEKYKAILDSKKTGAFYIDQKRQAWADITNNFNSLSDYSIRDEAQLKHFYDNIKHRAKKLSGSPGNENVMELPQKRIFVSQTAMGESNRPQRSLPPKTKFKAKSQKSSELLKIYIRNKIELVHYQKRNELQKFRNEQRRHAMSMQILELQLEKAKNEAYTNNK